MLNYYTDGSCSPNPGPGGYAVILDKKPVALGREKESTNIRMEGQALIAAMKHANGQQCEIYTDSEFWINVITKWAVAWEAKGWKKSKGEIKNLDLVKDAVKLYKESQAKLMWVKAHNNHEENERADEWANKARLGVTVA
jgi:ribonuclease HI